MSLISERLRAFCTTLRVKPTPLADIIPLLQQAADELDRRSASPPAEVVPSDMVLVPRVPTPQMLAAGNLADSDPGEYGPLPHNIYHAMLSAAPRTAVEPPHADTDALDLATIGEDVLRNPALLEERDGEFSDETGAKWAWFAHGHNTGMTPFYSLEQVKNAMVRASRAALDAAPQQSPARTAADAPAVPTHVFDPGCKSCHGTGRVCVGYSGREDDGNAPIIEQCDCFWPVSAEGVERALEEIARLEGALRAALATIPDAPATPVVPQELLAVLNAPSVRPCAICNGRGFYGSPGQRCEFCDGKGSTRAPAAPSASEGVLGEPVEQVLTEEQIDALSVEHLPEKQEATLEQYLFARAVEKAALAAAKGGAA